MVEKFFREDIKNFKPYEVGQGNYKIKLDANESFIEFPDSIKKQIAEAVTNISFNRYPDPGSKKVCELYSKYVGVNKNNVMAGNGSDELIQIIVNTFLDKGDKVAVVNPDFSMYTVYTEIRGGKVINFDLDSNLKLDVDMLIKNVNRECASILILSNPNNPTGGVIPREDIKRIVEQCGCIVVIDEAYVDFYDDSVVDEINNYENLIVLRTCSKALGSAALRLGFLITNKFLLDEIKKVKPPFNVNSVTQAIGEVILKNGDFIKESVNNIKAERDYLYENFKKIHGVKAYSTQANFVLIESQDADKINEKLISKGIKIRKFGNGRLKNCLRINAGTREENKGVIDVIKD